MNKNGSASHRLIAALQVIQWLGLVWLNPSWAIIAVGLVAATIGFAVAENFKSISDTTSGALYAGIGISQITLNPILSTSLIAMSAVALVRSKLPVRLIAPGLAMSAAVAIGLWPGMVQWELVNLDVGLGVSAFLALAGILIYDRFKLIRASISLVEQHTRQEKSSAELINQFEAYLPPQPTMALRSGKRRDEILHRRRHLIVFFSDIHGFTDRVEEMEPEDVAQFLNDYLTHMCEIANYHGGSIDKFIGDSLMITFGDDAASDPADNAKRCLRMALEMQKRITLLEQHWSERNQNTHLKVRMGISSGYCTTGNFGATDRLEYTAIGKQVNLASRLENLATPGQILCSYPVWKLTHEEFFFEPAGEVDVKGFARPVAIFSAEGEAKPPRIPRPAAPPTDAPNARAPHPDTRSSDAD